MTDITTIDSAQLQATIENNRVAAEEAANEVQRRTRLAQHAEEERQHDADRRIIEAHAQLDQQLEEEGQKHDATIDAAVVAGDFAAAFDGWKNYQATRDARRQIRDAAINAATRTPTTKRILGDLTYRYQPFFERLEMAAPKAIHLAAGTMTADLLEPLES